MDYTQQGPYGGQPQHPGPYGWHLPYGHTPYGSAPMPPAPRGGARTGLIVGAVAVMATIAVGAYVVIGGSGSGADIADDGPHRLTTPMTVLSEYKKFQGSGFNESDLQKAAVMFGVKNAHGVQAGYRAGDANNPEALRTLAFSGVYGEIEDPEAAVDAFFDEMKKKDAADDGSYLVGAPKAYTPSALDGAVLKCQEHRLKGASMAADSSGESKDMSVPVCVWGDNSTVGSVLPIDMARANLGMPADLQTAAERTARFRKEVRVRI